jgi:hypothetical protein
VLAACGPTAQIVAGPDGYRLSLHCVECDQRKLAFHMRNRLPDRQVSKKIEAYGWTLGRKPVCPDHKQEKPTVNGTTHTPPIQAIADHAAEVTDKARRARREALSFLEDCFDAPKGCFKGGENDASIAKACDLSEAAVAKLREEFYGPLKTPPELAAFVTELDAMKKDIAVLRRDSATRLEAMETRIEAYRKRIEAFATARGWSLT